MTLTEIARELQLKSASGVRRYLKKLETAKCISRIGHDITVLRKPTRDEKALLAEAAKSVSGKLRREIEMWLQDTAHF